MSEDYDGLVTVTDGAPPWERVFTVAPLVLVGTREQDGAWDLAPKHMAMPIGRGRFFGFVCTPEHATWHNAIREGAFTVTYLRPRHVLFASLAAAPRCEDDSKPSLQALSTFPAREVDGVFVEDGYLFVECRVHKVVEGFGGYGIITGRVVASHVDEEFLRAADRDDADVIHGSRLFAYLHPGRFSVIEHSDAFPFHAEYDVEQEP